MKLLASGLNIIKQNRKLYLAISGVYYGLVIAALVYALFDRSLHDVLMKALGVAYGGSGPLSGIADAYLNGKIAPAIGLTFGTNLVVGSFGSITLPSLIIPFAGVLMGIYRAILWGLIYSPEPGIALTGQNILTGALLGGVLLLEGQAYILTLLGVVLQGRGLLSPKTIGEESRWRGYTAGLKLTGLLYPWVTIVLLIAAVYEVVVAVLLIR